MADVTYGGRYGGLYRALDWVMRLAIINVLWILGTLAGAVVAGLAPSTVATFWLVREYNLGRRPQLWGDFWRQWQTEFRQSQLRLGFPLVTALVIVFYVLAARNADGAVTTGIALGLTLVLVGFVATLLYLPAVLAHFDLEPTTAWRVTSVVAWSQPFVTIAMLLASAAVVVAMIFILPGALPFFAVSLPAFLATKAAHRAFSGLDE